ncbi:MULTISPECIES: helix-turn-helix transcriptional regulator [Acidiphilium]|uniref:Xre family transcriptional regulator n=1 Tax=Acidiphilium multivorum (strain DSM 11245 / JCM 8867 / NBRC 100883 / AIU 301) TaxID=926570 RepID=F0J2Q2_ACIMA|nr:MULTISPECIES: helix-turn-helix transcriptional regulator [Acidiphilium]MBS3023270.1 helix-turn-helix domain-containing protein [Acidiphilium multivorum]BAJ79691.1 Xre family transcriptional regulator [Acidiphilium multivorum AIU301]GAN75265.1 transcriptional regulator XRE [Acidiphilium multivorum AIU301]
MPAPEISGMIGAMKDDNRFGAYLKSRRARLDPASLGLAAGRRRTAGLRREEVAQRAHISATWYTWLEQGRGGNPSAEVLDRIARALLLTEIEREHLFLLGRGHPPEARYRGGDAITPRLQRLLDALPFSPAIVRTATWDVVAWNRAAAAVFTNYAALPAGQRNILRMIFTDPRVRAAQFDWAAMARAVVGAFRVDAARAGADAEVAPLVDELCRASPEFAAMWNENEVMPQGDGAKRLRHPVIGPIALEYSSFAVDGRPDLSMIVYNPATPDDAGRVRALLASRADPAGPDAVLDAVDK